MKLTYKPQLIVSIVIILLANILSTTYSHWIYRSIGFVICGLLWVIHPVLPKDAAVSKRTLAWTRAAGVVLVLIGVFTRAYTH